MKSSIDILFQGNLGLIDVKQVTKPLEHLIPVKPMQPEVTTDPAVEETVQSDQSETLSQPQNLDEESNQSETLLNPQTLDEESNQSETLLEPQAIDKESNQSETLTQPLEVSQLEMAVLEEIDQPKHIVQTVTKAISQAELESQLEDISLDDPGSPTV